MEMTKQRHPHLKQKLQPIQKQNGEAQGVTCRNYRKK